MIQVYPIVPNHPAYGGQVIVENKMIYFFHNNHAFEANKTMKEGGSMKQKIIGEKT